MDIIYFPFTFVSERECRLVSACFEQWSVWMPSAFRIPPHMQKLSDNNLLSIEFPFIDKDDFMAPALNHLEKWADTHGHGHLRQSLSYGENQSKQTESSVYHILDAINAAVNEKRSGFAANGNNGEPTAEGKWVLQRRIFLQIAQAFDQHEQAIRNDMDMVTSLEHRFQEILHATQSQGIRGPRDSNTRQVNAKRDHGDRSYMLSERLEAWLCFLAAPGFKLSQNKSRIYVTASRAIEKLLVDALPELSRVIKINHIPVSYGVDKDGYQWRQSLDRWLVQWMGATEENALNTPQPPKPAPDHPTVSLSIYRTNMSIDRWIGRVLETDPLGMIGREMPGTPTSTTLAYIKNE